ncbi:MAG: hypothetical protein U5L95_01975 [Candidatus Saccharibacteria bacterium]|nr:hypothetical protein [Candidatus Saccharibacteria bacterium]
MVDPSNPEQASGVESESKFSHSGADSVPPEMREDHPTGDFGDMSLQEAIDAGLISPGDIQDPGTLPENVRKDFERPTAELSPEHPENTPHSEPETDEQNPSRNIISRKFIAVAGGVMLAGVAFLAAISGGNEDEPSNNTQEAVADEEVPGSAPVTAPIETDETPVEELPEELTPKVQYWDVDSPEELVAITEHNLNCMFNAGEYGDGLRCLDFVVGGGSGDLTNSLQESFTGMWSYRQDNPGYVSSSTYEVIDSSTEEVGEVEVIVKETSNEGEDYQHWKYEVGYMRSEDLSVSDDQATQVWSLYSIKSIEPGEVYFG